MTNSLKSKKIIVELIKLWLISGYSDELFFTKNIKNWIKEDGDEKSVMVRSVKLLRGQNRRSMFLLYLILKYFEKPIQDKKIKKM